MLTDDEIGLGGYRFEDLQALRIVTNRTDLNRKQKYHGFPKPIKTGNSQAWFPKSEVHAWMRERAALRDAPTTEEKVAETMAASTVKKRGPGRPKKQPLPQSETVHA